jgi:uncharacterized damage-inducible protein DinB/predicted RNase H-like HicB family nuclease
MALYPAYLEVHPDGRIMAHVLGLPGCITRAASRDEALHRLPDAICDYCAWLRRHGEPVLPEDEPIGIAIAGESVGFGPFDPGSAAALFSPDLAPVTPAEMERFFRLMGYARADLLALVSDLPADLLDWQPDPASWPIRRVLRHIGNAEEWYVSRIVPAETLPPEWEHDQELPILEFLAMERRTAVERLRWLTEAERSQVFYPQNWTDHPDEPWTARKVFRRFLEHELEHTGQVREVLGAWRARLLTRLAIERAGLLAQLTGLDERILSETAVLDSWTVKDLLAHVAAWDEFFTGRVRLILAGHEAEIVGVEPDERNPVFYAERRDWPLERGLAACLAARAEALVVFAQVSDEELHRRRRFPWGDASLRLWAEWRAGHDAGHAADLVRWRQAYDITNRAGPKTVLQAALDAGRAALLAMAGLIPPDERAARAVVGVWTLQDVLGHVADWEWLSLEAARQMAAGKLPATDYPADVDAWNQAHVTARREQSWDTIWADLEAARHALMAFLAETDPSDLNRLAPARWGPVDTAYNWVYACLDHDLEHVADLRKARL